MSTAVNAAEVVENLNLENAQIEKLVRCSGWYTVYYKGRFIDGGVYFSNDTGSACIEGFARFVKSLEAQYPGADIDFGM